LIPIRDTIPNQRTPYVVYGIVALNALAFFKVNLGLGPYDLQAFFQLYGIVPARYADPRVAHALAAVNPALPFLSSMFLHGGLLHFLGNMWTLWIFGDNVEDWFGHLGFLAFYLFCGVASGVMHLVANWGSTLPTIGASGAIAGVMGAYFLLYPQARVLTLVPIFIFIQFMELPAYVFLGLWFLLQFLSGTMAAGGGSGGIAWWAHIGGFLTGAAIVFVLGGAKPRRPTRTAATMKPLWKKVDDYWRE
jgi:membrane associated rhomboid family serine protease